MDAFRETSAPRKGIRDVNKHRLLALTALPLPPDHPAAAALPVPQPLAAADLTVALGLARDVAAAAAAAGGHGAAAAAGALPRSPYVSVWPAGAATNFRLMPGGATSWVHVAHGKMVSCNAAFGLATALCENGSGRVGGPLQGALASRPSRYASPLVLHAWYSRRTTPMAYP